MKIGDKVYVKNWLQIISDFYTWKNGEQESIFNWKTKIPDYSSINFHIKRKYVPKLTKKGTPYKDGSKVLVSETPAYQNYEYTILETTKRTDGKTVYLIASEEGCFIQILEKGLSTLTVEEQKKVAHLESEKRLKALAKDNLNKWDINTKNLNKLFPKELIKYLYDTNQNTCFGSDYPNTKAIIKYPYIPKEYLTTDNDFCLGWKQEFNGVGCDLTGKDTISWNRLPERFPDNTFE